MGGAHPLVRDADLQLNMDLPVNLLDVWVDVIGEQIVLMLIDLRTEDPESDVIHLIDWKQGCMNLVSHMNVHMACRPLTHTTHPRCTGPKQDVLRRTRCPLARPCALFLRCDTPSIEPCHVTSPRPHNSHRVSFDDDDDGCEVEEGEADDGACGREEGQRGGWSE